MAKIRKFKRVLDYLERRWKKKELTRHQLMLMHHNDLVGLPEMEGIGDRTISNVLKAFKEQHGALVKVEPTSKKKQVRDYIEQLLDRKILTEEAILDINYLYFINQRELAGIGKSTINSVLSEFRQRFEKSLVEDSILNYIEKENGETKQPEAPTSKCPHLREQGSGNCISDLDNIDVAALKRMIQQFNENPDVFSAIPAFELKELKTALRHFGIDVQLILQRYWHYQNESPMVCPQMLSSVTTEKHRASETT
jgi:hypothetical protein